MPAPPSKLPASSASAAPERISLIGLADRFIETHNDMPNRAFAFVLGAGASRSSGIKTAGEMVDDWIGRLYREAKGDAPGDPKAWATKETLGISKYDPSDPAASYSKLYHRMFIKDPDRGYAYLEAEMRAAEPSYGYSVLARIMDETQHKVVVTTNFDNLVADSLSIFSKTYPLVCGHESLAGFIRARARRPLVVKVHRDLLLAPKSTPEEIADLPEVFKEALRELFRHYTPIVIGYGGNDGSLMAFLNSLDPKSLAGGVFWCFWQDGAPPSAEVNQFVAAQDGCLVPVPGFDETMMLLGDRLDFDVPDKFLLKRAEDRAKRIVEQAESLRKRLIPVARDELQPTSSGASAIAPAKPTPSVATGAVTTTVTFDVGTVNTELAKAIQDTMQRVDGERRWWQWDNLAEAEPDPAKRDQIYVDALKALPKSAPLLGNYANFLTNIRKDHDTAEEYYKKALEVEPGRATTLGNYALFLTDIRNDHDKAEEYYKKALEAEPGDATFLGNYAILLKNIRKDHDKAEEYYKKALDAEPGNPNNLGNYAIFLTNIRKDYDKAEEYYKNALEAKPGRANNLGNYAIFLTNIRKDYDKADEYYKKALEAEPGRATTLGNYANFLTRTRKDHDKAEQYYKEALEADPGAANELGNYASLLLTLNRAGEGLRMLDQAISALDASAPTVINAEVWMYAACHWLPDRWREALGKLKVLLVTNKLTTDDWDFSGVIAAAKKRDHPGAEWLDRLAEVCAGKAAPSTLAAWEAWSKA